MAMRSFTGFPLLPAVLAAALFSSNTGAQAPAEVVVVRAARTSLKSLTGQDFGPAPDATANRVRA